MINNFLNKLYLTVDKYNLYSEWLVKPFDIAIFDVNFCLDKVLKKSIMNLNSEKNFISVCLSTDSYEKRNTIKEFIKELESSIGQSAIFVRNLSESKHFYIYFEYSSEYEYNNKLRKVLLSKPISI